MEFASTPENRLKYLGEGEKAKYNDEFLRFVAKFAEAGHAFGYEDIDRLMSIIDTMCIMADNRCAQNEKHMKRMKNLLASGPLLWLIEDLGVKICTEDHD